MKGGTSSGVSFTSPVIFPTYGFVVNKDYVSKDPQLEWSWAKASEIVAVIQRCHGKSWTPTEMLGRFGISPKNSERIRKTGGEGDSRPIRIMTLEGDTPKFVFYDPSMLPSLKGKEFYVPAGWARKVIQEAQRWDFVVVTMYTDHDRARRIGVGAATEDCPESRMIW